MEFRSKKRINKYDRVMSRVYDRSRSTLNSTSNVMRHRILSSSHVGAKPLSTNFNSSVFSDLPTVLNDYEPDKPAERTFVVKPRRTVKSLDPAKSPQQAIIKTQRITSHPSYMRTPSSAPSFFHRKSDKLADVHLRECHSSRSHSKLKELKNEIQAYHETEKYMKLRGRLYKSCGVVLDDMGQVTVDKGVQAESDPVMVSSDIRFPSCPKMKSKWIDATSRGDNWFPTKISVICSRHFTEDNFCDMKNRRRLLESALPTLFLPILSPVPVVPCPTSKAKTENNDIGTTSSLNETGTSPAPEHTTTKMNLSPLPTSPEAYDCPVQKRLCRRINELEKIVRKKNVLLKRFREIKRRLKKRISLLESQLDDQEEQSTEEGIVETRLEIEPRRDPLGSL